MSFMKLDKMENVWKIPITKNQNNTKYSIVQELKIMIINTVENPRFNRKGFE